MPSAPGSSHLPVFRRLAPSVWLVLIVAMPISGRAAEQPPTPTPPTSVSVTFGKDARQDGIKTWIWSKPGGESVATYAGKTGLQTDLTKGAWGIWGDVSDAFIHGGVNRVMVSIEYWDRKAEDEQGFKFYYDSTRKPMARAPMVFFEGSQTWKTASYYIENAGFAGRQEGGADFKLFSTDTDLCIRSITLQKVPDGVAVSRVMVVPDAADLIEGERRNLTALYVPHYAVDKGVTWSTSDPAVATVNPLGQVTGVATGKAVITATTRAGGPQAVCNVKVTSVPGQGAIATSAGVFLDSIGVNTAINERGENLAKTIACAKYLGFRWIRSGLSLKLQDYLDLHKAAGIKFSLGFGGDINRFVRGAKKFADAGMLLAFEGPNEPNNWGFKYQDEMGGGSGTWRPVAKFQRDFYAAVKNDPRLRSYPVWHLSEGGAEVDNVGVQFLQIPRGSNIAMPDGTQYADDVCVHNYCCHPSWGGLHNNQAWLSSDPTSRCPVDGLYKEFGKTWGKNYQGYSDADLLDVPRVTTETGITIEKEITEEVQGRLYLAVYLAQYKQGWSYTSMYILRDRVDEGGNQTFGFYRPDYTPRKAGLYLHNMTTILADTGYVKLPGRLDYSIPEQPETVHDLLLQKSDGRLCLVVWGERYLGGTDNVTVNLGGTFKTATLYDPTVGTTPVQKLENVAALPLALTTNPVIIELR